MVKLGICLYCGGTGGVNGTGLLPQNQCQSRHWWLDNIRPCCQESKSQGSFVIAAASASMKCIHQKSLTAFCELILFFSVKKKVQWTNLSGFVSYVPKTARLIVENSQSLFQSALHHSIILFFLNFSGSFYAAKPTVNSGPGRFDLTYICHLVQLWG